MKIREILELLMDDSWYLVNQEGSHRQFKHPHKKGCVATGETPEEVVSAIKKAVQMHLQGIQEDGLTVPRPSARADYLQIEQAV